MSAEDAVVLRDGRQLADPSSARAGDVVRHEGLDFRVDSTRSETFTDIYMGAPRRMRQLVLRCHGVEDPALPGLFCVAKVLP